MTINFAEMFYCLFEVQNSIKIAFGDETKKGKGQRRPLFRGLILLLS
jgi:hypothetical protein